MNPQATGVVDVPFDEYLRHPALSASGAKKILQAPARYRWDADNPPESTATFDFGKAAHARVLGAGEAIVVLDYPDYRTKAAQQAKAEAVAVGAVPLLKHEDDIIRGMATALLRVPLVRALLSDGQAEQCMFWQCGTTGVGCRARADWLPNHRPGRRLIVSDYKTATSAKPSDFRRSAAEYGYHLQAAWYLDGIRTLGLDDDPAFVFIVQEKTAPYLSSVVELDGEALILGMARAERARRIYATCTSTGHWPAYGEDVHAVSLPQWAYLEEQDEAAADLNPDNLLEDTRV